MQCPNCGKNVSGSTRCWNCGAFVREADDTGINSFNIDNAISENNVNNNDQVSMVDRIKEITGISNDSLKPGSPSPWPQPPKPEINIEDLSFTSATQIIKDDKPESGPKYQDILKSSPPLRPSSEQGRPGFPQPPQVKPQSGLPSGTQFQQPIPLKPQMPPSMQPQVTSKPSAFQKHDAIRPTPSPPTGIPPQRTAQGHAGIPIPPRQPSQFQQPIPLKPQQGAAPLSQAQRPPQSAPLHPGIRPQQPPAHGTPPLQPQRLPPQSAPPQPGIRPPQPPAHGTPPLQTQRLPQQPVPPQPGIRPPQPPSHGMPSPPPGAMHPPGAGFQPRPATPSGQPQQPYGQPQFQRPQAPPGMQPGPRPVQGPPVQPVQGGFAVPQIPQQPRPMPPQPVDPGAGRSLQVPYIPPSRQPLQNAGIGTDQQAPQQVPPAGVTPLGRQSPQQAIPLRSDQPVMGSSQMPGSGIPDIFKESGDKESGAIEVASIDMEMEVVSTADFQLSDDLPTPGFFEPPPVEDDVLPAFKRSMEDAPPRDSEGFDIDQEQFPRPARFREKEKMHGSEMIYKIITIGLTIISFFTLSVLTAVQHGIDNPYDKLFPIRLLIFAVLAIFTVMMFFKKDISGQENKYKMITISLAIAVGLASILGRTGVGTSGDSNFLTASIPEKEFLYDRQGLYAKRPAISPDGNKAVMTLYSLRMGDPKLAIIDTFLPEGRLEAESMITGISCDTQPYWIGPTEILYAPKKIWATEVFRLTLLDLKNELSQDVYTSRSFNISNDYDYLREKQLIVSSFGGVLWLTNLNGANPKKLTGKELAIQDLIGTDAAEGFTLQQYLHLIESDFDLGSSPPYSDTKPRFNKKGDKVFFIRQFNQRTDENDIYMIDLNKQSIDLSKLKFTKPEELAEYFSTTLSPLTNDSHFYGTIAASPSGRFVAAWCVVKIAKGARMDERALILYDTVENVHIKIFPDYETEAWVENIDWSEDRSFLLVDMNTSLKQSIIRIDLPRVIVSMEESALEE